ncbi:MAG: hypothetical protein FJ263_10410 [Planctomycetes bacterium]|nr:hypothetical protein [Planctomycetota bacterium]
MKNIVSLACVCAMFASGCASIIHGKTEKIGFTSEPPGAKLAVGGYQTVTPAYLTLERRGQHTAYFTMSGYETQAIPLHEGMSLWFLLGNLGFGGIPGWIIDSINGSIGDLSPDNVHAVLVPKDSSQETTTNTPNPQAAQPSPPKQN